MRTFRGEGSGSLQEGDGDSDSEKDALHVERESIESQQGSQHARKPATTVMIAEPFLGSSQQAHNDTPSGQPSADSRRRGAQGNVPDAVSWRDLPRKKQLVVITLARLSEPLVQTSLQVRLLLVNFILVRSHSDPVPSPTCSIS